MCELLHTSPVVQKMMGSRRVTRDSRSQLPRPSHCHSLRLLQPQAATCASPIGGCASGSPVRPANMIGDVRFAGCSGSLGGCAPRRRRRPTGQPSCAGQRHASPCTLEAPEDRQRAGCASRSVHLPERWPVNCCLRCHGRVALRFWGSRPGCHR